MQYSNRIDLHGQKQIIAGKSTVLEITSPKPERYWVADSWLAFIPGNSNFDPSTSIQLAMISHKEVLMFNKKMSELSEEEKKRRIAYLRLYGFIGALALIAIWFFGNYFLK